MKHVSRAVPWRNESDYNFSEFGGVVPTPRTARGLQHNNKGRSSIVFGSKDVAPSHGHGLNGEALYPRDVRYVDLPVSMKDTYSHMTGSGVVPAAGTLGEKERPLLNRERPAGVKFFDLPEHLKHTHSQFTHAEYGGDAKVIGIEQRKVDGDYRTIRFSDLPVRHKPAFSHLADGFSPVGPPDARKGRVNNPGRLRSRVLFDDPADEVQGHPLTTPRRSAVGAARFVGDDEGDNGAPSSPTASGSGTYTNPCTVMPPARRANPNPSPPPPQQVPESPLRGRISMLSSGDDTAHVTAAPAPPQQPMPPQDARPEMDSGTAPHRDCSHFPQEEGSQPRHEHPLPHRAHVHPGRFQQHQHQLQVQPREAVQEQRRHVHEHEAQYDHHHQQQRPDRQDTGLLEHEAPHGHHHLHDQQQQHQRGPPRQEDQYEEQRQYHHSRSQQASHTGHQQPSRPHAGQQQPSQHSDSGRPHVGQQPSQHSGHSGRQSRDYDTHGNGHPSSLQYNERRHNGSDGRMQYNGHSDSRQYNGQSDSRQYNEQRDSGYADGRSQCNGQSDSWQHSEQRGSGYADGIRHSEYNEQRDSGHADGRSQYNGHSDSRQYSDRRDSGYGDGRSQYTGQSDSRQCNEQRDSGYAGGRYTGQSGSRQYREQRDSGYVDGRSQYNGQSDSRQYGDRRDSGYVDGRSQYNGQSDSGQYSEQPYDAYGLQPQYRHGQLDSALHLGTPRRSRDVSSRAVSQSLDERVLGETRNDERRHPRSLDHTPVALSARARISRGEAHAPRSSSLRRELSTLDEGVATVSGVKVCRRAPSSSLSSGRRSLDSQSWSYHDWHAQGGPGSRDHLLVELHTDRWTDPNIKHEEGHQPLPTLRAESRAQEERDGAVGVLSAATRAG